MSVLQDGRNKYNTQSKIKNQKQKEYIEKNSLE